VTDTPIAEVEAMPDGARLHIPIPLRWGDLDAFNHVNNTSMLKLLEESRVRAFWLPDPGETAPPTAVLESSLHSGVLTLIARQEIEYLAPVPYQRHPLDVQMWFGKLGGSSIEVCYEVCSPRETAGEHGRQTIYARGCNPFALGWGRAEIPYPRKKRQYMGIMDSIKGMFGGGNKAKTKDGIDKAADAVGSKAGKHADKVDKVADVAKDAVDKLPD